MTSVWISNIHIVSAEKQTNMRDQSPARQNIYTYIHKDDHPEFSSFEFLNYKQCLHDRFKSAPIVLNVFISYLLLSGVWSQ